MADSTDDLRAAAEFGGFFAADLTTDPLSSGLAVLISDAAALRAAVAAHQLALAAPADGPADGPAAAVPAAAIDERAAASVWFLGVAARLVSPPIGAAVLAGAADDADAHDTWTRAAERIELGVMTTAVEPLLTAVRAAFRVSPRVLWGDVASAVAGAATVIALTRPDLGHRAGAVAQALLATPRLAGTGTFGPRLSFRRASCCLLYRIPPAGLCGDCVLRRPGSGSVRRTPAGEPSPIGRERRL